MSCVSVNTSCLVAPDCITVRKAGGSFLKPLLGPIKAVACQEAKAYSRLEKTSHRDFTALRPMRESPEGPILIFCFPSAVVVVALAAAS